MQQFCVIAYDGEDEEAPVRRHAARPAHFEVVKAMSERGEIKAAGAIVDDQGRKVGNILMLEFPSRLQLDQWLEREPYVSGGVWKKVEVKAINIAILDKAILTS